MPLMCPKPHAVTAAAATGTCSSRPVGHAEIKPSRKDDVDGWQIVYMLAREHWGKGLATELAGRIAEYGFKDLGLDKVYASIDAENKASRSVVSKLGFQLIEVRKEEKAEICIYKKTIA
ncbi:hypothetical protein NLG97_g7587 [Lecanicillium saksenae]|uniref:Uncharacterized protein n=1 Tax=Lecanicillium saksenae TaxID=468837 RepID=A0ACC1QLD8_9HYPO|nr:hypothetical protein NLG97_g7587 [Lecanicillium saksenae]